MAAPYDDNAVVANRADQASRWLTRYPDLAGKTMIVAGESSYILAVTRALAANGALLAIVAPDRGVVEQSLAIAELAGGAVFGMTADPSSAVVWKRIASHIEQRLGPIDVVVSIATAPTRRVIASALLPDMAARQRGVLIEAGAKVPTRAMAPGVRHRAITGGDFSGDDLAATVLMCASDTLTVPHMVVRSAQAPV
jgi:NAD(P)-dependent dehydrogenase (short-subunit alcohol dehydrogenase family)